MKSRRFIEAFTLIELLVVIAIIGILAAIAGPVLGSFKKGDAMLSGSRQMLDAMARARQLAIAQRTTVYLVFVPPSFWADPAFPPPPALTQADRMAATNLAGMQYVGFNFVTLRSVGDQPGQGVPRYLASWQTLPETAFIAPEKFALARNQYYTVVTNPIVSPTTGLDVYGFDTTTNIPFPLPETAKVSGGHVRLPYIAFDYLGRVVSEYPFGRDGEFIPLGHGSVGFVKDPVTKRPAWLLPSVNDAPPGNSTNTFKVVLVDWLTGRARVERLVVL
jgi:prepilin-type N-terminal cleavage/methylation domain-containing protein